MKLGGRTLERRALSLGLANAIDYAIHFLMPIVLVRALEPEAFGQYRQLWLLVYTVLTVVVFYMPYSLYYFLPRSEPQIKRLYVNQTILFMGTLGVIAAAALWLVEGLLRPSMGGLLEHGLVVHAFLVLWIATAMLDTLPAVGEHVAWQAKSIVGLSVLRAGLLSLAAIFTGDMTVVLLALLAFAGFRLVLLVHYVARHYGLERPLIEWPRLREQFRYAAPFAISNLLFGLRKRGDEWIAATLFPLAQFAAFSIATALTPIVVVFRQSVNQAFMPSMSRRQAERDTAGMLALNNKANVMVGAIAYPLLAFCFVFAEPLVAFMYTEAYLEAVPVMRLYALALMTYVVDVNGLMMLLRQGKFGARLNVANLCIALPISFCGALVWGLPGAALGSVVADCVERVTILRRISHLTGVPFVRLQNWRTLGSILAASAAAACVAYALLARAGLGTHPFLLLAGAAAAMAIVYPLALVLAGQRALLLGVPRVFRTASA